ncbi:MAG: hypothetical protein ABI887_01060 [Burkholderiales bacterium]
MFASEGRCQRGQAELVSDARVRLSIDQRCDDVSMPEDSGHTQRAGVLRVESVGISAESKKRVGYVCAPEPSRNVECCWTASVAVVAFVYGARICANKLAASSYVAEFDGFEQC